MNKTIFLRRSSFLPNNSSDYPLTCFLFFMIPVTYWFEIWVVIPTLFSENPVIYWFFFILGHFCLHNVLGNFLAIFLIDTSIKGRKMPDENEPRVQFCNSCNTYTPPRSFHCPSCDVCILKRDHHCIFTGYCVGFYNHRYFALFVFYVMVVTVTVLPLNMYFLYNIVGFKDFLYLLTTFVPILLFMNIDSQDENLETKHIYLVVSLFGLVGSLVCLLWFYFHMKLILQGTVVHELKKCIRIYDLGREKNLELVFGKRWHLTWISPYIQSPLLGDGIRFPVPEDDKK